MTLRHGLTACALLALAACADPVGPVDPPAQFISMRRAWQPGERDSTIARIKLNREFNFLYIGDISDDADKIYADTDSVTVIVANPDFGVRAAGPSGLMMAPQFQTSWNITGIDVRMVNTVQVPQDTIHWIGVFWSNPANATQKGFAIAGVSSNPATTTVAQTVVNTTAFDASGARVGVGAGEAQASTGTIWLANGPGVSPNNTLQVTAAAYGGTATVTTGPFLGGTYANGTMQGRMRTIDMARSSGAAAPATFQVDFNFTLTSIGSIRYVCVFRTPCTTNVPLIMASLRKPR